MWCACKAWRTLFPTQPTNWVHGPSRTRPSLQSASSKELWAGMRRRIGSSAFSFRWCNLLARFRRVWSIAGASKPYISPTTPSPVQSLLKFVIGCHVSPRRSDRWYASLHPYEPNNESQVSWSPRFGVCGPIFALWFSVVQFHRSGVCGLIFAIWFFVGLDFGFCTLGFWFSLSWLLVPGFWFLCSSRVCVNLHFLVFAFVHALWFGDVHVFFFFLVGLMFLFFYLGFLFDSEFDVIAGFISWFKKNIEEQVLMFSCS